MLSDANHPVNQPTPPPTPAANAPPQSPGAAEPIHGGGEKNGLKKRARRRTGVLPALSYGVTGFLLGIAFWHTVGFWNLVSTALFSGPRSVAAAPPPPLTSTRNTYRSASDHSADTGSITTGSIATGSIAQPSRTDPATETIRQNPPVAVKSAATVSGRYPAPPAADTERCSTFIRDMASGEVNASTCPPDRDLLAEVPAPGREDKAKPIAETGWSTAIEPIAVTLPADDLP